MARTAAASRARHHGIRGVWPPTGRVERSLHGRARHGNGSEQPACPAAVDHRRQRTRDGRVRHGRGRTRGRDCLRREPRGRPRRAPELRRRVGPPRNVPGRRRDGRRACRGRLARPAGARTGGRRLDAGRRLWPREHGAQAPKRRRPTHTLQVGVDRDGAVRLREQYTLDPGERRVLVPVSDSGRYEVRLSLDGGDETGRTWWACPPHGPATVTIDARGTVTLSQAGL